ncbi:hypothetical protein [Dactylosporangium sp. CA-139066]|uniref:hypothetical protein n=1 Tax=Dactylosporangium sp. CA-139066 TaxID=3239930 RepID=UPI003D8FF627
MSSDMTSRGAAGRGRGERPRPAADRCPVDAGHTVVAVPALLRSGLVQIGFEVRHGPGGVQGRSVGQAQAQTPLAAALAPPPALPSWRRPIGVAVAAGAVLALLVLGAASSASGQDVAALQLFGTVALTVAAVAGLTAWSRRRAQEHVGAAHAAAAAAWRQARFCGQCGASFVSGDRRMVETDRVLGQVLLRRAKADLAHD